jgi:hypothetical protein
VPTPKDVTFFFGWRNWQANLDLETKSPKGPKNVVTLVLWLMLRCHIRPASKSQLLPAGQYWRMATTTLSTTLSAWTEPHWDVFLGLEITFLLFKWFRNCQWGRDCLHLQYFISCLGWSIVLLRVQTFWLSCLGYTNIFSWGCQQSTKICHIFSTINNYLQIYRSFDYKKIITTINSSY